MPLSSPAERTCDPWSQVRRGPYARAHGEASGRDVRGRATRCWNPRKFAIMRKPEPPPPVGVLARACRSGGV